MENGIVLAAANVSKRFGGVQALDKVQFELHRGEVHALVGENGAGKSTLIKIICGLYQRDEGSILYNGKNVDFRDNLQARMSGVGIVPQEIQLAPKLTVAENIFMGMYPRGRMGLVSWKELRRRAGEIAATFAMERFLDMKVEMLGTGHRQLIEILKALVFETRIIAFDEPTAALSDEETRELFTLIGKLKAQGISLIYVSHRLDEIFQIADRVTVFKDGRYVATREIGSVTKAEVISLMVGRDLNLFSNVRRGAVAGVEGAPAGSAAHPVLLEVEHLNRGRSVQDISFSLRGGEILGFFGMVGSGRTETAMTIFGVTPPESGEIRVKGKIVRINSPIEAVSLRIGLVPENRIAQGVILNASIRNNITLPFVERLSRLGFIRGSEETNVVARYMDHLRVKAPSGRAKVRTLSGGNQQKVSIAKWLASRSDIIIFDEPTHGVDVGAKAEIYHLLRELADQGKGILFISSELPEVLNVCDRIFVYRNGRIARRFEENRGLTEETVIKYAIGNVEAGVE
jgi:ribose transport system ATP-binding protein